jgi:hypothetical protein
MESRSVRNQPSAVLAAIKAAYRAATAVAEKASLDCGCARRLQYLRSGRRNDRLIEQRNGRNKGKTD